METLVDPVDTRHVRLHCTSPTIRELLTFSTCGYPANLTIVNGGVVQEVGRMRFLLGEALAVVDVAYRPWGLCDIKLQLVYVLIGDIWHLTWRDVCQQALLKLGQ